MPDAPTGDLGGRFSGSAYDASYVDVAFSATIYPHGMSKARAGTAPVGGVQALAVLFLVASTALTAHFAVAAEHPAPADVVLALALAAIVSMGVLAQGGRRAVLSAVLVGQAAVHTTLAVAGGAAAGGCVPLLARAARAGLDLAVMGLARDCSPGQVMTTGTAGNLAVMALLSALPVLIAHVVAAALGDRGLEWGTRVGQRVLAAVTMMAPRLPVLAPQTVGPLLSVPIEPDVVPPNLALVSRGHLRRGPPDA